jgi:hypothetical protein
MRITPAMPLGRVIAQGVGTSHTGDTNETTLATITVPANAMGANGQVVVRALFSKSGTAGTGTYKVKFGGTNYHNSNLGATTLDYEVSVRIANVNATNSQVGVATNAAGGIGSSTAAKVTSAIDTTADVTILLTGTLGAGGDTVAVDTYQVILYPRA